MSNPEGPIGQLRACSGVKSRPSWGRGGLCTAYQATASSARRALAKDGPADPRRLRDAEVAVEALFRWQELGLVPQMPFVVVLRDVAEFFQAFGDP